MIKRPGDTEKPAEVAKPSNESAALEEEFTALDVNEDGAYQVRK